jgi:hypothetical protein
MNAIARTAAIALALIVIPGAASLAEEPADTGTAAEPKICRITETLGTRLSHSRICKTRAEWVEYNRQLRATVADAQTHQVSPTVDGAARTNSGRQSCPRC